jgi:selenocysteine lyase/cysteine desulfurase
MSSVAPLDARSLRPHYAAFLTPPGPPRILLTGHSHQAWPDVAREGLAEAFDVAARDVDDKWDAVFAAQSELRVHTAARLGCAEDELAFAPNTHELGLRFLSALALRARPRVVTTTGEFHSAFRQLRRLAEEGLEVVFVPAEPVATLAERLAAEVDDRTSAVIVSTVLFGTASVVPGLPALVATARARGAEVMLDAYHGFDAMPVSVPEGAFLVAGGYKYAQWGEGVCFLRVPAGCTLRPIYTGWFAGFAHLADRRTEGPVGYEVDGATRFAGSTFDPASTFRARAVARFFDAQGMTPERLRATSLRQTARILAAAAALPGVEVATPREDAARGGFVSLRTPRAGALVAELRARGVFTDARGDLLRLGPAPYVLDEEIDAAMDILGSLLRAG